MSKYQPLKDYLLSSKHHKITLDFGEIEKVLSESLPKSARTHRAWWSNEISGTHVQAKSWIDAGYRIEGANLYKEKITFIKSGANYQEGKDGSITTESRKVKTEDWSPLLTSLKRDVAHGSKAPYKSLLLLWMVGRYLNGYGPIVTYQEAENPLKELMKDFQIGKSFRPSLPFIHLASEPEIWMVTTVSGLDIYEKAHKNLRRKQSFLRREARGCLTPNFLLALNDSETCKEIVRILLDDFSDSERHKILKLTELEIHIELTDRHQKDLDSWEKFKLKLKDNAQKVASPITKKADSATSEDISSYSDEELVERLHKIFDDL